MGNKRSQRLIGDLDQLHAALQAQDGKGAAKALKNIEKKDPDAAAELVDYLVVKGLKKMTGLE